jgi:hypothetical protein
MDLALAFGACNVICQAPQPEDIAATCVRPWMEGITRGVFFSLE